MLQECYSNENSYSKATSRVRCLDIAVYFGPNTSLKSRQLFLNSGKEQPSQAVAIQTISNIMDFLGKSKLF